MNLPNYLFIVTIEHGYLLVRPEDIQTILPIDPETQIPLLSNTLDVTQQPVIDSIGNQWILLEEDCQAPEFIERLADHHLANTLECTGRKDEAAIVDQIISGYQHLKDSQHPTPTLTSTPES